MARKSVLAVRPAAKSQNLDVVPVYRCDRSRWLNVERALRSTAFLLAWNTDNGNEPLDGPVAYGLSRVLDNCAEEVAAMREFFMAECLRPARRAGMGGAA
jgi:hypothetical protein